MYTTEAGKELQLTVDAHSANFVFQWASGGELPQGLKGKFTDEVNAKKAVDKYKANIGLTKPKETEPEEAPTFIDRLVAGQ